MKTLKANSRIPAGHGTEESPSAQVRDVPDPNSPGKSDFVAHDPAVSLPYPFHPLANVFPLMEGRQFNELVEDLRINGLNELIVLHEGAVLDGRNRLRACIAAGAPYQTVPFKGADPVAFVISANVHRRHLSTSQRSVVAAELANMRQGARTDLAPNGAMSQADAANLLNVSRRSVQRAAALRESGDPALVEMVKRGAMTVQDAVALVKLPDTSEQKFGSKGDREIPEAAEQSRPDCDAGPHAAPVHVSRNSRWRTARWRTADLSEPPGLFPELQSERAIEDVRRRNNRSLWIPQTKEEQFAEWIAKLAASDEWQKVFERLRDLDPKDVIRALRKGPMLRLQQ